jgi:small subunit ribosomal protein S17
MAEEETNETSPAEPVEAAAVESDAGDEPAPSEPAAEAAADAEAPLPDEGGAEAAAAEDVGAGETDDAPPAAPAEEEARPEPRKKKRLPRPLRRQRAKPKREQPAARKPIVRQPKPVPERGRRQERRGVVVSTAMDKTIVVKVDTIKAHPRYKKVVRRSTKFHAHDERNEANVGDLVLIVETRPLSKTKHWRLAEIVEAAR